MLEREIPTPIAAKRGSGKSQSVYRVQVLDRALAILEALAESSVELGTAELATALSLHRSTIHRLLTVLEQHHLVRKNPARGKYALGLKLFEWGSRAVEDANLRDYSEPFLRRLVDETGETAHICILSGTEALSVANVEGAFRLRSPSAVGRRAPVHCTAVGKALIAFWPEHALAKFISQLKLVRRTRHTLVTSAVLKTDLARVRAQGYAVDDEEFEEGLRCISAPLRNYTGRVVASIGIAGPVFRLKNDRVPLLARSIVAVAGDLSKELGHRGIDRPRKARSRDSLADR